MKIRQWPGRICKGLIASGINDRQGKTWIILLYNLFPFMLLWILGLRFGHIKCLQLFVQRWFETYWCYR